MDKTLISVIIPAYNVDRFLGNCLDSVLKQTYENIEIMLIDDGSTDETGIIADRYMNLHSGKLKVIHMANCGVIGARFTGIQASRGEWIGFVDGDDEIEPDMYERLYNNAMRYGADISHCGYKTIVNGGERVHEFYNTGRLVKQNKKEGIQDFLNRKFEPSLCNKLFRSELVKDVVNRNVIDPAIKYNEDVLMNYYLFKAADGSVFEDFCGYHYLSRTGSATRNRFKKEMFLDPVKVRRQIACDVSAEYKDVADKNYILACMNALAALHGHIELASEYQELREILKETRGKWHLLRRNDEFKLRLMMFSPGLFNRLYRVYERSLQKKQYE